MKLFELYQEIKNQKKLAENHIAWEKPVIEHIKQEQIPLTPKISQILFGNKVVKAFHVSDILHINDIKNIAGTKKTISAFMYMLETTLGKTLGVQTLGGIIYEVTGILAFQSIRDIMSQPDENGIRWINHYEVFGKGDLANNWLDTYHNHSKKTSTPIKDFFNLVEDFIEKHREEITFKMMIRNKKYFSGEEWDEILLSNITIHDVYCNLDKISPIYYALLKHVKSHFKNTPEQKKFLSADSLKWIEREKKKTIEKLEQISTGKVYNNLDMTPIQFVSERGGFLIFDKSYYKHFDKNIPTHY